jgi:hypothetical protein
VQFGCSHSTFCKSHVTSNRSRSAKTLVRTSQINYFASSGFTEQHALLSEPQWRGSTLPAVFQAATPSANFNCKSPGHRNQPPTSNIKSSASSFALCKWSLTLPQNQKAQKPPKIGDSLQGMESTSNTPHQSRYLHTQGPHQLHTRLPPTGLNLSGPRTSLQRPLPGLVPERQNTADRVKPAYVFNEDNSGHTISKPATTAIPTSPSATNTTRSGWHVHFPVRFTS